LYIEKSSLEQLGRAKPSDHLQRLGGRTVRQEDPPAATILIRCNVDSNRNSDFVRYLLRVRSWIIRRCPEGKDSSYVGTSLTCCVRRTKTRWSTARPVPAS